jgi:hypothetical protein
MPLNIPQMAYAITEILGADDTTIATVTPDHALKTDGSAVTQPVSIVVGTTPSRVVVSQGGAATTILAAATPGMRHKVIGLILTPVGGGISSWRFTDSSGNLTGPIRIPGGSAGPSVWPVNHTIPLVQTAVGSALNLVSVGDGYAGVVIFVTEP